MSDEKPLNGTQEVETESVPNPTEGGDEKVTVVKEVDSPEKESMKLRSKFSVVNEDNEYSDDEMLELMKLYEETMAPLKQGNIINGTVLMVNENSVIVDIGFKSEGFILMYLFYRR